MKLHIVHIHNYNVVNDMQLPCKHNMINVTTFFKMEGKKCKSKNHPGKVVVLGVGGRVGVSIILGIIGPYCIYFWNNGVIQSRAQV